MAGVSDDFRRVAYFYDSDVGNFYYGQAHPMKPHRIRMTHNLLINYGLYEKMEIYRPHWANKQEMTKFHSDDYIDFLSKITPDNMMSSLNQLQMFNVGEDCPVFDGMYEYCQISAGGSIDGAVRLNHGLCDIAVNWAGGLHHAKKSEASGFCYVNDIVLGILELLKYHHRVLYIDIDIHHGDGVEEAFYSTDRVMTLSFHKYGDFFPGTGDVRDTGVEEGKNYALNFPLHDGLDDESFMSIYEPIVGQIMEVYRPDAVVLQSGADSLTGDRLGCFNLSMRGHALPLRFLKKYNVPILLLGGGGYTIRNVARAWTYETAIALGEELPNDLPYNDYVDYYGPDYKLHITTNNMANLNTPEYLEKHKQVILETLRHVRPPGMAPGRRPPDTFDHDFDSDDDDPDVRDSERARDKRVANNSELLPNEGKLRDRTHADVVLRTDPKPIVRVKKGGLKMEAVHGSVNREVDPLTLEVAADPNAPPPTTSAATDSTTTPAAEAAATAATTTTTSAATTAAASTSAATTGGGGEAEAVDTVGDVEMN